MKEKHYLTPLFEPRSVGIIGASDRDGSIGAVLFKNMLDAGFKGRLYAINPKHKTVLDKPCYASIDDVPHRIDLAVIATPAATIPTLVEACGHAGCKAVVILSAGFSESGPRGAMLERATLENARRHKLRILGPNCLGFIRPDLGLNASFAQGNAHKGSIALVSQSGALCTSILDWAKPNNVGFSNVISLGASADIDFGEVVEYLMSDPRTESIFLYVEGIRDARRFMSALRGAARVKPVLVIKVGRNPAGSAAALMHTGAMVGEDSVFDAALRRAGAVRMYTIGHMFAAAGALFTHFHPRGDRLAIITNGGGPAVMAADRAADLGIPLAQLAEGTAAKLDKFLPPAWSKGNPVDILGDADAERYGKTLEAVLEDPGVDGVMAIMAPQAMSSPSEVARTLVDIDKKADKPILACWIGREMVMESRRMFVEAGVPSLRTPEPAVELFSQISAYYKNQKLLVQTPASLSHLRPPSIESARLVIETALSERRKVLNEMESKALLAAFRIPIAQTVVARSATEAMVLAEEIGLPVVMKIDSPDITSKADSGGVRLNLGSLAAVRTAYQEILDSVRKSHPEAAVNGVAIEPMIVKPNGRELMVGSMRDAVFGPVITFGEGGNRVDVQRDRSVALPPLNPYLARDLIRSARIAPMLGEFRTMPPVDMKALEFVLLRVSEMVCELPWIQELKINPLIVDESGAVAVDAGIVVDNVAPGADRYAHMAIHPYPSHLTSTWQSQGSEVTIRPIKPEDADMEVDFVRKLSPETKYFRFMNTVRELPPAMVVRLTQIDYFREMAFVATVPSEDGETEIEVGVCRYAVNPDGESCEFAVVVADDWQHRGLARKMMGTLIETARDRGLKYMNGVFLSQNERMLKFVQNLGFVLSNDPDDNTVKLGVLTLQNF